MSGKRFENQSAVITGGADGIGKAIARRLGGAEVTIFDLNEASIKATVSEFAEAGGLSLPARSSISRRKRTSSPVSKRSPPAAKEDILTS